MNIILNASYKFTFGDISFQVDLDESLLSSKRTRSYSAKENAFHSHPFHEIFFVLDGETEIVFENGVRRYQGCIVCLPPNVRHYTKRSSDYRILFSYRKKSGACDSFGKFISEILASSDINQIPITSQGLRGYLEELCDVFYNRKNELDSEVISSILKCIFYSIYSSYSNSETMKKQDYLTSESRYIIISSIIAGCTTQGNEITLATVADALCLSHKQTSRLIFKYYGRSLSEVVTDEKLNYAAYLLRNSDLSIYDIAFESNFHSYSYFCQLFKRKFGCLNSPLNFVNSRVFPTSFVRYKNSG